MLVFKEHGYDVEVYNLVNPEHSDGIDLIKFIDKEIDAQVFAQVVISTTQNTGKKGEEFWHSILASGDMKKLDVNNKKMVIYCITSDMDSTMSFLNSLFF